MSFYRIAYVMNHSMDTVTKEDAQKLTHINLAFALLKNGRLDLSQLTQIHRIRDFRRWNPELKIVLSVGGWAAGGFSTAAMTEDGRKKLAASCLDAVEQYALDGIDIDWEYPCSDAAGIDADPRDRENFTLLLQAIRDAIGKDRILSVAMGADESCAKNAEMDKLPHILDYVQLMTYDMCNGFSTRAGHHAALSASRGDTSKNNTRAVVDIYHNGGVPYEKMIIGAAFYARHFEVETNVNNGLLQPSGPGISKASYWQITPEFLAEQGFAKFWDEEAEAAYLWNGKTFVSYESAEAIRRKSAYVKETHLLGLMYWEHGHDRTKELLGIIAAILT